MNIINSFLNESEDKKDTKDFKRKDSVKCIVYNEDNQILLLRRTNCDSGAGNWDLAGGAIEVGENFIDAIKREVFEETNLKVDECKKQKDILLKIPESGVNSMLHLYTCKCDSLDVQLKPSEWFEGSPEHTEYKWIKYIHELQNLPMLEILKNEVIKFLL